MEDESDDDDDDEDSSFDSAIDAYLKNCFQPSIDDVPLTQDDIPTKNGLFVKHLGHFAVNNPHAATGLHFVETSSFKLIYRFIAEVISNVTAGVISGPSGLGNTTTAALCFAEASLVTRLPTGIELL